MSTVCGPAAAQEAPAYPETRTSEVVDVYHGEAVPDPYRWLEDMDSDATRAWMQAQDALLRAYVDAVPQRARFEERILALSTIDQVFFETKVGERIFAFTIRANESDPVLTVQDGDGEARVLFDPAHHSETAGWRLASYRASPDGSRTTVGTAQGQSPWQHVRVLDVEEGRFRPEVLTGLRGSVAWLPDGQGFFYTRYALPEAGEELTAALTDPQVFFHRVGTPQSDDRLVYAQPDRPTWPLAAQVTRDGRYLLLNTSPSGSFSGMVEQVYVKDLSEGLDGPAALLLAAPGSAFTVFESEGPRFWVRTSHGAPRGRVVTVALDHPEPASWREVLPERDETLTGAWLLGGHLAVQYIHDARPLARVYGLDGALRYEVPLPDIGSMTGFSGSPTDATALFRFSGLYDPGTLYRLDVASGQVDLFIRPALAFDPADFVTRQVFYESKDGTRVPMFVSHRRDLVLDGTAPTLLYGYGVFGWVAFPWFQPHFIAWMEQGGVYALPNIRGGGEYGEAWHQAGVGVNRQNAIDDFIAAGQWLIDHRYTRPERLVANGGSASGHLPASAFVQRADLFGAGVTNIAALDMLRYHRFTGAASWVGEFGSVDDPAAYRALRGYSPYHNIEPGTCYPPMLVTVGERDATAPPLHSYKFVARMQAAQACAHPVLLKIAWGAGHSFGVTRKDTAATWADTWAFLFRALGLGGASAEGTP